MEVAVPQFPKLLHFHFLPNKKVIIKILSISLINTVGNLSVKWDPFREKRRKKEKKRGKKDKKRKKKDKEKKKRKKKDKNVLFFNCCIGRFGKLHNLSTCQNKKGELPHRAIGRDSFCYLFTTESNHPFSSYINQHTSKDYWHFIQPT